MRPAVAHIDQLIDQTAFGFAQDAAEDVAPARSDDEHDDDVLQGVALTIAQARVIEHLPDLQHSPVVTVPGFEFTLDEEARAPP